MAKRFSPLAQTCLFFSDASSLQGCGAICVGITSIGSWPQVDRSRRINELELLSTLYALQTFSRESCDILVHLILDNSTAVTYINKCGGTCFSRTL